MDPQVLQAYYDNNPRARRAVLAIISFCYFLTTMTLSSTHVALPAIGNDLGASALLLSWVPTAYLLTNIIFLLPFGRLADSQGRKKSFVIAVAVLSFGTLCAGLAPDIQWLLAARVVQGMGGAMLFACGMAIVLTTSPARARGTAIGVISGSAYLGISCGPLVGGFLTEYAGWRSVFLIQVPFGLAIMALTLACLKGEWKSEAGEPFDWLGSLLMGLWMLSLSIGFSLLPGNAGLALIALGVVSLVAFIRYLLGARFPLVNLRAVWRNRVFSRAMLGAWLMYASGYPLVFLLSLYLQYILGMSPSQAGSMVFMQALIMSVLAPVSGRLADHYQPEHIAAAGCLVVTGGFAILMGVGFDTSPERLMLAIVMMGVGMGLFTSPNNSAGLGAVSSERLGMGSALLNLARNFGNIWSTVIILSLMSLFLGGETIREEQYPALLFVTRLIFSLSFAYALVASVLYLGIGRRLFGRRGTR